MAIPLLVVDYTGSNAGILSSVKRNHILWFPFAAQVKDFETGFNASKIIHFGIHLSQIH
jgi:hypothetical protein